jgi:hypothetical protein
MDIYKRLPYYLGSFNINYIIFKIVETFGSFFFPNKQSFGGNIESSQEYFIC